MRHHNPDHQIEARPAKANSIFCLLTFLMVSMLFVLICGTDYWQLSFFRFKLIKEQWIPIIGITLYLALLIITRWQFERRLIANSEFKKNEIFTVNNASTVFLAGLAILGTVNFILINSAPTANIEFFGFFGGAIVGQGVILLDLWFRSRWPKIPFRFIVLISCVFLLSAATFFQFGTDKLQYHGYTRWCGPWKNPNTYGLLMGVGIILALGCLLRGTYFKQADPKYSRVRIFHKNILWLIAVVIMAVGWIESCSRGAWVATLCGIVYLFFCFTKKYGIAQITKASLVAADCQKRIMWHPKWRQYFLNITIILASLIVVLFLNCRNTDQRLVRRVMSVGNENDMSWRNRIDTSIGSMQIISDKPLFGYGWNQPESIYNNYYRPVRLVDGKSIILNCYLMLGTILGFPALACLLVYYLLRFRSGHKAFFRVGRTHNMSNFEILNCRAGFVVLFVGLMFNAGLFYIPLNVPLWILLELGSVENENF